MQTGDSRIISQIKEVNLNSASELSDLVEVSPDCNSCRAKASLLFHVCVCLCAANCGREQSRRGMALINSDAELSEAPKLSHQGPLDSPPSCVKNQSR